MNLESPRLIYVRLVSSELENYLTWYTNSEVMKFVTGKGLTEADARLRFHKALSTNANYPAMGFYSVKSKDSRAFVGIAKLVMYGHKQGEVGYGSMPQYWQQGYATEMLTCLIERARNIPQIEELMAIVNPENIASKKVLLNQGFVKYDAGQEDSKPVEYYRLTNFK